MDCFRCRFHRIRVDRLEIYALTVLLSPARASVFADLRFGFTDFADGDLTISEGRDIVSAADLLVAEEHLSDDSHPEDCGGFGLGVLVELDGCIRYRDERLGGRAESWTDLCHPTFAMTGALAWRGRQHGFVLPRVSPPVWCALSVFVFLFHVSILLAANCKQSDMDSGQLQMHRYLASKGKLAAGRSLLEDS
ncbi:hypothetical protein ACFX1Q_019277 [Malus domestica]